MANTLEILQISNLPLPQQRRLRRLIRAAQDAGEDMDTIFSQCMTALGSPTPKEEEALEFCVRNQIAVVLFGTPEYPDSLGRLFDPPLVLFVRGSRDVFQELGHPISIVGSRRADKDGISLTKRIVSTLSHYNVTFISGLAFGIDAATHWAALRFATGNKCPTLAVMPCGLDTIYPRSHEKLSQTILESGGALISEFFPGTQIQRHHFLQRNRIVAALSQALIIVQAGKRSGARSTASVAADLGIEVFAIPGPIGNPLFEGNHDLLREGATLLTEISDLPHELKIAAPPDLGVEPVHEQVCDLLREQGALSLMNLQNELARSDLSEILLELESTGSLVCLPGGYYKLN
ncbi:DNA-protecting protein DprA [bacterium]|nr:DNA-protecting protein DprA [bacterium]